MAVAMAMMVVAVVGMRSTGCKIAIKRELARLDCKKSIKFSALLPSEGSNCVDHTEAKAAGEHMRAGAGSQVRCRSGAWVRARGDRESESAAAHPQDHANALHFN